MWGKFPVVRVGRDRPGPGNGMATNAYGEKLMLCAKSRGWNHPLTADEFSCQGNEG